MGIATMRASTNVAQVLPPDTPHRSGHTGDPDRNIARPPAVAHPSIEQTAANLSANDAPWHVALACVSEACGQLATLPGLLARQGPQRSTTDSDMIKRPR